VGGRGAKASATALGWDSGDYCSGQSGGVGDGFLEPLWDHSGGKEASICAFPPIRIKREWMGHGHFVVGNKAILFRPVNFEAFSHHPS